MFVAPMACLTPGPKGTHCLPALAFLCPTPLAVPCRSRLAAGAGGSMLTAPGLPFCQQKAKVAPGWCQPVPVALRCVCLAAKSAESHFGAPVPSSCC